jgi:single-strand DNA-binding protein
MINKVILVGNVGMDPEVRSLESGVKVARLRLATTERIFNRQTNESTDHTEWHTVTLWRGLADVADKFVRKGSQIYIEGRLRSREWDKDGVKHTAVEIVADEMKLLGRRTDAPQQSGYAQPQQGGYQGGYAQPQQSSYQGGGYSQPQGGYAPQSAPAPQPMAPSIPAEDPDDMPF